MRKFLTFLLAANLSTISISQIVACSNPFFDENVLRVSIVTDGHTINDHSFNESTYDGALQFKNQFDSWADALTKDEKSGGINLYNKFHGKHIAITVDQPNTTDLYTLLQGYQDAYVMHSFATVASGYIHYDALVKAQNSALKGAGMRYVYVDGDTPNSVVPAQNKNLLGILYEAEQSGFLAGIAGLCWLTAHNEEFGGLDNLKVSAYGGQDISSVTNYMYGFYWAVQLWNYLASKASFSNETYGNLKTNFVSWINKLRQKVGLNKPIESLSHVDFINLPNQFTGDFNQSSAGSQALNDALVDDGAQVIFPVSGPQVADTLAAVSANKGKGMVIGVDTDEQKQFPSQAGRFITSALKNIKDSVSNALWNALDLNSFGDHSYRQKYYKHIFSTDSTPKGGQGYTGIADNQAINPIYGDITTNEDLSSLLPQVSAGWQKILAVGSNFWNNSEKASSNPFEFN